MDDSNDLTWEELKEAKIEVDRFFAKSSSYCKERKKQLVEQFKKVQEMLK